MAPFDDLPIVKDIMYPVKDYNSFTNYLQKQAVKFHDNIFLRYQILPPDGELAVKTLTYGQVDHIASNLACDLHSSLGDKTVIALIEDHSVYYLILNLAIYKLRIPLLLLSTRNSSQAVCDMLKQTEAQALVYGERYHHIKEDVLEDNPDIDYLLVPDMDFQEMAQLPLNPDIDSILDRSFTSEDLLKTVIIVHSSGTTSLPKPVRWSNQFQLYQFQAYQYTLLKRGQFEFFEDENDTLIVVAPLCHMSGLFSTFYGTVNGSSVFYFHQFPPPVKEVFRVFKTEKITRFSAPPFYIDQMLHHIQETGVVQALQNLKFIISGGAPTPKLTDEFLLKHKINFVTMYIMSECTNLMSSEVSLNRVDKPFDGEKHQLIIRAGSPFLATDVANRDNGDYATKDLFIKSKVVQDAYIYVGRTDDILVMLNGEKTNPFPMEDIIKSNPMVLHCTVIGEGQQCTAALIELNFEVAKNYSIDVILEKVHKTVQKANKDAPSHSTILPEMVKIIPFATHLPVSDKGTVSRKRAIDQFQDEVDSMYAKFLQSASNTSTNTSSNKDNSDISIDQHDIESKVLEAVSRVLKVKASLQKEVSLFKQGLNSLLSIQLRNYISEEIQYVPQDFLYDHSTISSIVDFFESRKLLQNGLNVATKEFNYQDTTDILNSYLNRASEDLVEVQSAGYFSPNNDKEHVVLLTGATGSLGSAILLSLLRNPRIKKVYALVRGDESTDLMGRISKSFESRQYPVSELYNGNRIEALHMSLEKGNLGLSIGLYDKLKSEVTMIQACAWMLDFNQPVKYYDSECINGLYNLVKFANREVNPIHLHFISSISASGAYGTIVPESPLPSDPRVALPMGYSQSKFIVEQLFHYLVEQKKMPCYIYRVGQLCGNSSTGCWNSSEMYPLTFIGGGSYMKKIPNLDIVVDWLPVDDAGDAIVNIMMDMAYSLPSSAKETVFHIVNPNEISWSSLLESMKSSGMVFDIVDPEAWVQELSQYQDNPAYKLISAYEKLFKNNGKGSVRWETDNTCALAPNIKQAPTVNDRFSSYLSYWKGIGFYSAN